MNNTKIKLCKLLIGLFTLSILISAVIYSDTQKDYIHAKANIAKEKISSIKSNIWNLNPKVATSELDEVTVKRNICIGVIVISIIGIIICSIFLYDEHKTVAYRKLHYKNQ